MKRIQLNSGLIILVDDVDHEAVAQCTWWAKPSHSGLTFYVRRHTRVGGRITTQFLHHFLLGARHVDHVDLNGLNNQRANLRVITEAWQQNANQRRQVRSKSGYKGVVAVRGHWQAKIQKNGRRTFLGNFDHAGDAALAYDAAARELFGEFARLNFPADEGAT